MGVVNSKNFKIDEATSNSSLSNLRYVITEKPKWKVFKKKEMVPLPPYRPAGRGCPCGNDSPCKQKVTPNGVTIHYPQNNEKDIRLSDDKLYVVKRKKKFSSFGLDRSKFKPTKVQRSNLSRSLWKSLSSALPFQTRINANVNISIPVINKQTFSNAFKAVKLKTLTSMRSKLKRLPSLKSIPKKGNQPKRVTSADFLFMPFR